MDKIQKLVEGTDPFDQLDKFGQKGMKSGQEVVDFGLSFKLMLQAELSA
jgi:hypothetical protein